MGDKSKGFVQAPAAKAIQIRRNVRKAERAERVVDLFSQGEELLLLIGRHLDAGEVAVAAHAKLRKTALQQKLLGS